VALLVVAGVAFDAASNATCAEAANDALKMMKRRMKRASLTRSTPATGRIAADALDARRQTGVASGVCNSKLSTIRDLDCQDLTRPSRIPLPYVRQS